MNNDLDQKIQAALRSESSPDTVIAEPNNVAEEFIIAFRNRQRWFTALLLLANIGTFIGLLFAGMKFYNAPDVMLALRWGGVALAFFFVFVVLKVWFWLEIHTNRVLREVKRVELLLLSKKANS